MQNLEIQILTIEKVVFGGKSLAKTEEGVVVFTDFGLPEDKVEVAIEKRKKHFLEGKTVNILAKGPHHNEKRQSLCKHFGVCGGCQWLTAPPKTQLKWKNQIVWDFYLKSVGKKKLRKNTIFELHTSTHNEHYRNRIQLRGHIKKNGDLSLGYFRRGSHSQLKIEHCSLADDKLNQLLSQLNKYKLEAPAQKFRLELQVIPQLDHDGCILATLHHLEGDGSQFDDFIDQLNQNPLIAKAALKKHTLEKQEYFPFSFSKESTHFTSPGAFQQVNLGQNTKVKNLIKKWVHHSKPQKILDLYAGSLNLSLQLAIDDNFIEKIDAVEASKNSCNIAKENIKHNNIENKVQIYNMPVERFFKKLELLPNSYQTIIADPSRNGMKEVVDDLLRLKPNEIIYMSCDPATAFRDIARLDEGYDLEECHLFDFFPNTYHIETLSRLTRKSN